MAKYRRRLREAFYKLQKGLCHYCKKHTPFTKWTLDHKIPKTRGGLGLDGNKVGSCFQCNHLKADLTDEEFMACKNNDKERRRIISRNAIARRVNDHSSIMVKRI